MRLNTRARTYTHRRVCILHVSTCTGVQSNYQQPWGNPLIPAHEFTLPDRLIPYEITGHPRCGLGLGARVHTGDTTIVRGHARCMRNIDAKLTKKSAPKPKGRCILYNLVSPRAAVYLEPRGSRFNEVITFNEKLCVRSRGICFGRSRGYFIIRSYMQWRYYTYTMDCLRSRGRIRGPQMLEGELTKLAIVSVHGEIDSVFQLRAIEN